MLVTSSTWPSRLIKHDRRLVFWDLGSGLQAASFAIPAAIPTLDFSPDGRVLVVGDLTAKGRGVRILHAPSFEEIAAAEGERPANLLKNDRATTAASQPGED